LIVLPSTTTRKPSMSASDLPSKSRRFENAMGATDAAVVVAAVLPDPAANTPGEAPMATQDE
jgi:hypothetical protein